ncbi:eCIS core domain-containing protein [Acidicapsa acidisoli]|uniref:eCIS core domain-containing protein n=1 Tax=Acidicapsa acidisoli TaxID=1615681 RepID=UPI0021E0AE81|nr:DUF4157 domain-containing protein [Acidicapsa acidisoli]
MAQPAAPRIVHEVLRSPGEALDAPTRSFMESRFGRDFSRVRVHSDELAAESARSVNAAAYTVGSKLVFDRGQYASRTHEGRKLIAHELAHVVQQSSGTVQAAGDLRVGDSDSPQERAADNTSSWIMQSHGASGESLLSGSADRAILQRQPSQPGPPPTTGGLDLTVDLERGSVSVSVSGPSNTPLVPKPTIGLRRDASGQYHVLIGGKDKVVTLDEIPGMLRKAVGAGSGTAQAAKNFRIPTCHQLQLSGKERMPRFMTFEQYKLQQRIWHGQVNPLGGEVWLELTKSIFDALIELCFLTLTAPPREAPEYNDAPNGTLPKGSLYA